MAKPLVPDELWEIIQPLLPPPKPRRRDHPGRKPVGDRRALTGILFVLKTGIPWEDLPREMGCGCGMTCWRRLQAWQHAGVWPHLHEVLLAKLNAADKIDWSRAAIDSSFARARGPGEGRGPNPTDRGRPGVKHHVLDRRWRGCRCRRTSARRTCPTSRCWCRWWTAFHRCGASRATRGSGPTRRNAYRAYDSEPHREQLRERGIEPKLARRNTEHGSGLGVFRWVAERTLSWLHGFRKLRSVTEYGLDMQYACLDLAMSLICWRILQAT
jgi:transposase